jgi:hypothetical protein
LSFQLKLSTNPDVGTPDEFSLGLLDHSGSSWFSPPGAITDSQITMVSPTPEPASLALIAVGLSALYLMRRRNALD